MLKYFLLNSLWRKKTSAAESFIGKTWNEIRTLGFYIFQLSVLKMLSHAVRQSTLRIDCHHINPDWQTADCQEFKFYFLSNKRAFFYATDVNLFVLSSINRYCTKLNQNHYQHQLFMQQKLKFNNFNWRFWHRINGGSKKVSGRLSIKY